MSKECKGIEIVNERYNGVDTLFCFLINKKLESFYVQLDLLLWTFINSTACLILYKLLVWFGIERTTIARDSCKHSLVTLIYY